MTASTWFLVFIATQQYIGPLPQASCQAAAVALVGDGIVCRQAAVMTACPVPDRPGSYMPCPLFEFPKVTIKEYR